MFVLCHSEGLLHMHTMETPHTLAPAVLLLGGGLVLRHFRGVQEVVHRLLSWYGRRNFCCALGRDESPLAKRRCCRGRRRKRRRRCRVPGSSRGWLIQMKGADEKGASRLVFKSHHAMGDTKLKVLHDHRLRWSSTPRLEAECRGRKETGCRRQATPRPTSRRLLRVELPTQQRNHPNEMKRSRSTRRS